MTAVTCTLFGPRPATIGFRSGGVAVNDDVLHSRYERRGWGADAESYIMEAYLAPLRAAVFRLL